MLLRSLRALIGSDDLPQAERLDPRATATAALLVEAALLDGAMDSEERRRIVDLMTGRFGLDVEGAERAVAAAEGRMADTHQLLPFTRTVKDSFSDADKVELLEMLWEVIYADGRVHDYEAGLMRRLGGLIYVSDVDIGAARKRVLARLGGQPLP